MTRSDPASLTAKYMKRFLSLSLLAVFASVAFGQPAPKNQTFSTKLKSVAVFRDGFGYYVREGRVKLEDVDEIVQSHLIEGRPVERLRLTGHFESPRIKRAAPSDG